MPKHTKKELKRHSKKDLLGFARNSGIVVKNSVSKNSLVELVYKNKSLRESIPIKEKRKMSEKQLANLAKFRFKKDQTKNFNPKGVMSDNIQGATYVTDFIDFIFYIFQTGKFSNIINQFSK